MSESSTQRSAQNDEAGDAPDRAAAAAKLQAIHRGASQRKLAKKRSLSAAAVPSAKGVAQASSPRAAAASKLLAIQRGHAARPTR